MFFELFFLRLIEQKGFFKSDAFLPFPESLYPLQ